MIKIYNDFHEFKQDQVIDLWKSVGWTSGSIDHPDRLMKALKTGAVYSVFDDERLIGILEAFDDSFTVFLNYLLIHPDYQHSGIGSKLMEMFEKQFEGYRKVVTTDEAKAFYEKFGFKYTSYGMHQ